ncbi:MAG: FAD-dependent oxidoreductase [Marinilabiliales bacterium]|nr:FAD-dependent oxidoreductase [Marinilabiliales bacterium]
MTNLVNGATRLQPVVLQIGQASQGLLAALAVVRAGTKVSEVPVGDVQNALLDAGGYLPFLTSTCRVIMSGSNSLQRIGSTGIMKGRGFKNAGWSNQTFFRAE